MIIIFSIIAVCFILETYAIFQLSRWTDERIDALRKENDALSFQIAELMVKNKSKRKSTAVKQETLI